MQYIRSLYKSCAVVVMLPWFPLLMFPFTHPRNLKPFTISLIAVRARSAQPGCCLLRVKVLIPYWLTPGVPG